MMPDQEVAQVIAGMFNKRPCQSTVDPPPAGLPWIKPMRTVEITGDWKPPADAWLL
jgi:hypothetical protein